jgi:hypothetical protein
MGDPITDSPAAERRIEAEDPGAVLAAVALMVAILSAALLALA